MEVLTTISKTKAYLLVMAILIGLFACGSPTVHVQVERVEAWMDYYGIDWDTLEPAGQFGMPYKVEREFILCADDPFLPFYIFSPDSTRAIDLDSYHLVLEEGDDGSLYSPGREADMEVGLIDLTEGLRTRILFCGPSCVFEEAGFDPKGTVIVAGFADNGEGFRATVWTVCQESGTITLAQARDITNPADISYLYEKRLHKVEFWHRELETQMDIPL